VALGVYTMLFVALGMSVLGYALYRVATNPPDWPHWAIDETWRFDVLGALGFVVPVTLLTTLVALGGLAVLRHDRAPMSPGGSPSIPPATRWQAQSALPAGGALAGLALALVSTPAQVGGDAAPLSVLAVVAASALGVLVVVAVGWAFLRPLLRRSWRRTGAVTLVALCLTGASATRKTATTSSAKRSLTPAFIPCRYGPSPGSG
jgi:hypothetical protein